MDFLMQDFQCIRCLGQDTISGAPLRMSRFCLAQFLGSYQWQAGQDPSKLDAEPNLCIKVSSSDLDLTIWWNHQVWMLKFPCWILSHFSFHGHAMFYLFAASFLPEDGRSRRRAVERARWLGTPWGFRSNWGDTRQGCLKLRVWNVWRDEGEINLKPVTSFFQTCSLLGKISWGRKCHCRGYWNWHDQRGALQWQTRYLLKNVKNLRKEMINHLGTIAKSGTKAFMEVSYRADLFRVCPFSVLLQMTFCHRGCIFWGRHVDDRLAQWQSNDICIFWNVSCILYSCFLFHVNSSEAFDWGHQFIRFTRIDAFWKVSLEWAFTAHGLVEVVKHVKPSSHQVDQKPWRIEVPTSCQKKFVWFQRATMMNSTSGNPLREALKFNIWCTQAF